MKKILIPLLTIIFIFYFSISNVISEVYHFPEKNMLIILHPGEKPIKPNKIIKPELPFGEPIDNNHYELLGLYLPLDMGDYYINTSINEDFSEAIKASFDTWDMEISINLFEYAGETTKFWYENDEENVISFARFFPREYIAVTVLFYQPDGNPETLDPIIDFDIIFNMFHKWGIGSSKAFDVQNISTHEVGHVVGLKDLYNDLYRELTMYGYGRKGEISKRTLENGDILGLQEIYGL